MKHAWLAAYVCPLAAFIVSCGGPSGATLSEAPGHAGSDSGAAGAAPHGGQSTGEAGTRMAGGSSAQAGAGANAGTGGAGGSNSSCSTADLDGLSVYSGVRWDPHGYPPYALDGYRLVYVAPADGGGALHLRDLATGEEVELEPAASEPRRPTLSGEVIAWEIGAVAQSQVRVSFRGNVQTLTGDFDHAGEPRAAADAVVFTAFLGPNLTDDTDVYLYAVQSEELSPVAAGAGQQRFADVSLTHVAVTDFSEDPHGYFNESESIADLLIIDRQSGVATPRKRAGKQAFPLLGSDDALVYLDWGAVHPEPKFSQFGLRAGVLDASIDADYDIEPGGVTTNPAYLRPSLHGQNVDFVDSQGEVVGLYRFTLGSQEPPAAIPIAGSPQLFGPVASDAMTLIAKPLQGQTLTLTAVAR